MTEELEKLLDASRSADIADDPLVIDLVAELVIANEKLEAVAWEAKQLRADAAKRGIIVTDRRYCDAEIAAAAALEDLLAGVRRVAYLEANLYPLDAEELEPELRRRAREGT